MRSRCRWSWCPSEAALGGEWTRRGWRPVQLRLERGLGVDTLEHESVNPAFHLRQLELKFPGIAMVRDPMIQKLSTVVVY